MGNLCHRPIAAMRKRRYFGRMQLCRFILTVLLGLSLAQAALFAQADCGSWEMTDRTVVKTYSRTEVDFAVCQDPTCPEQGPGLRMFVYKPTEMAAGYTMPARFPLMLMIPGGGFMRTDAEMSQWPEQFVKRGMIVATIDYRVGWDVNGDGVIDPVDLDSASARDCEGDPATMYRAVARAVLDARTAIRFLLGDPASYPIDPDALFCGGVSAGAEVAVNLALAKEGELESTWEAYFPGQGPLNPAPCTMAYDVLPCQPPPGAQPYYTGPIRFRGVMSCWGATLGPHVMDPHPLEDPGDSTPDEAGVIAFHGVLDKLYPVVKGPPYNCPGVVEGLGGKGMFMLRREYGYPAQVYLDPHARHKWVWLDDQLEPGPDMSQARLVRTQFIVSRTVCFFKSILCGHPCSYDVPLEMASVDEWAGAYFQQFGTGNGKPVGCNPDGSTRFKPLNSEPMLYPNPSSGWFRLMDGGFTDGGQLELYDAAGRVVMSQPFARDGENFDLRSLPNGFYMARLFNHEKQITLKLALQRRGPRM